MLLDYLLVFLDHFLQRLGVEAGIKLGFLLLFLGVEYFVEGRLGDIQDYVAEHLDEAAIGIGGKARIVAALGQGLDALIVEAEIQDGIHHAGHGEFGARAHADQQRILAFAELLALQFFQFLERRIHLALDFGGHAIAAHVFPTSFGLNGEAGRHGQAGIGHLSQASAFAAKVVFHLAVAVSFAAAKREDILGGGILFRCAKAGFRESLRRHNRVRPLLFRRFFGFFAFGHDLGEIGDRGKFLATAFAVAPTDSREFASSSTITITLSKNCVYRFARTVASIRER